jgi:hypothetical protein
MGLWVRPIPRGGFAPSFPRSAPRVHPRDPFRVAQPSPGSPQVGLRSSRWLCPDAPRLVLHEPPFPEACSSPGRREGWRPLLLHVRPRRQPGGRSPVVLGTPPLAPKISGPGPCAQGNLNKDSPIATHCLQLRAFSGPLTTRSQPRQWGDQTPPPPGHPPGHLLPEHPP